MVRGFTALLPSVTFDWSDLAASATLQLVMVERVGLEGARSGELVVRVHDHALGSNADSTFELVLEGRGFCAAAPELPFIGPPLATVQLTAAAFVPSAVLRELRWPWPAAAQLRVVMRQSSRPETNRVRVSVGLALAGLHACDCADAERGAAWAIA